MIINKKLRLIYNKKFVALFSNYGSPNPNNFYLLMTYSVSEKNRIFNLPITEDECEVLLKEVNKEYTYYKMPT